MKIRLIQAFLMSLLLSSLMSCWLTWFNLGLNEQFLSHWLSAFIAAWPVAGAIAFFTGPEVHEISMKLARL